MLYGCPSCGKCVMDFMWMARGQRICFAIVLPFFFSFHSNWNMLRPTSLVLVGVRFNQGAGPQG